ncbi:MAG: class I tRNA ligase family protein, partial [Endomicrobiia bacterium]
ALNLPLPRKIFAHGYFTIAGQKMSKTIGNVIKPSDLVNEFGSSASRILILNAFPFGSDGDISINDFREKYNAHLANNIGNLISRVLNMVVKYFDGKIEKPSDWADSEISPIKKNFSEYLNSLENFLIDESIKQVLNISSFANQYIDKESPWSLVKTDKKRLATVLYNSLLILKHIAILLAPFAPSISEKLWKIIDEKQNISDSFCSLPDLSLLTGNKIAKPLVLFPKK